jgi:hypothetical protein
MFQHLLVIWGQTRSQKCSKLASSFLALTPSVKWAPKVSKKNQTKKQWKKEKEKTKFISKQTKKNIEKTTKFILCSLNRVQTTDSQLVTWFVHHFCHLFTTLKSEALGLYNNHPIKQPLQTCQSDLAWGFNAILKWWNAGFYASLQLIYEPLLQQGRAWQPSRECIHSPLQAFCSFFLTPKLRNCDETWQS